MKISSDFKEVIKNLVITLGIFLAPVLSSDFSKLYINIFLYLVLNIIFSSTIILSNKKIERLIKKMKEGKK